MTLKPQSRRFRQVVACIAVLLLSLCAEGLHELLSPHRVCGVHGTLEHGQQGDGSSHGDEVVAEHSSDEGAQFASESGEGLHEACGLVAFGRARFQLALPPRTPEYTLQERAERPDTAMLRAPWPPTIAPLRLAPKNSPPLA